MKVTILTTVVRRGFSLLETMITLAIFSLIVVGLIGLVTDILKLRSQQTVLLTDIDQARRVASQITNELRNAETASSGAYVLDTAQDLQIIFYSDVNSASAGRERVRYFVQNGKLYKGITNYNGSGYNLATEQTYVAQNDVANSAAAPLFNYYDGTYTGAASQSPLAQPVNVTNVKFIKVTLRVFNKGGVQNTSYFTVTASASVRNLKTNLGS